MALQHFKGAALGWLNRGADAGWAQDPGEYDADAVARTVGQLGRFFGPGRPWEAHAVGLEHLPSAPALVVSNHSGGTSIPDAWGLAYLWYGHFGTQRPLHYLAHEWVLPVRRFGEALARRGVLWADRDTALAALTRFGRDVIVFPGGDLDSWRPWSRRYEVEFGGHKGYARLALEAGVPVVPLAHAGAQETLRVLTDGRSIARWLQLTRATRAHVFPIHLSLPFGLTVGPWPHLPWPARMRYRFGPPVQPPPRDPERPVGEAEVDALDAQVRARVGAQLRALRDG